MYFLMTHEVLLMIHKSVLGLGAALLIAPFAVVQVSPVQASEMNIVQTAEKAGNFKTLTTALKAADLVKTLEGKGPYTVFAPTDEAFAKLPKGELESLLKPENKAKLTKILTYHVVSSKILAKDIKPGMVKTVGGGELAIKVEGKKVEVDGASVAKTDVLASNGVIHTIDKVLIPK